MSTSTMHNFLNFDSLEVFLDFLETLRCPIINPFVIISFLYSMLMYEALTKMVFFVDFQKWPIMSKFITSCECSEDFQNEMRPKGLVRGHLKLSKKSKNTSKSSKLKKLCIVEVIPKTSIFDKRAHFFPLDLILSHHTRVLSSISWPIILFSILFDFYWFNSFLINLNPNKIQILITWYLFDHYRS